MLKIKFFITVIFAVMLLQQTKAQPVFIKTIPQGSYDFFNSLGNLYFFHNDSLWKSNGTSGGTVFIKDLGQPAVEIRDEGYSLSTVFFFITQSGGTYSLWRSNGTFVGTTLVNTYQFIKPLEVFNNEFYYSVLESGVTRLYKAGAGAPVFLKNLNVIEAEVVAGSLMLAVNETTGEELWKTNGTSAGTVLVRDFPLADRLDELTNVNGILFFQLMNPDNTELWKSNGTTGGTTLVNAFEPQLSQVFLGNLTAFKGKLYFSYEDDSRLVRFYTSDGTAAGTVAIQYINFNPIVEIGVVNDMIYFVTILEIFEKSLWRSDGTMQGTFKVMTHDIYSDEFTEVSNHLFFSDEWPLGTGRQLWQSDLTINNTKRVNDIFPGTSFPNADNLTNVNDVLYFTTWETGIGMKLWKYNPLAPVTLQPFFTVVNAATDGDISWLMEGDTIVLLPGETINVRFNSIANPGSVRFMLNGPTYRVENVPPFALAGDNNGDYNVWPAVEGNYTLVVLEYANDGASGALLGTHTIHFYVNKIQLPVVNAGADKTITLPTSSVTLTGTASDPDGSINSVWWEQASGPSFVDIASPSSLLTNVTDFSAPGIYTLMLTVTDNEGYSSSDLVQVTVNPAGQSVTSFTLVNADTDTDIMTLNNGAVINFSTLPTNNVNIRANTSPAIVGSVRFMFDGITRMENVAPYALHGDNNGDYNGATYTNGPHSLTATPYTGSNATGTSGTPLSINFTVTNSPARLGYFDEPLAVGTICFPNPSSGNFMISVHAKENGFCQMDVCNGNGKPVEKLFEGNVSEGEDINVNWNAEGLKPGLYILTIKTGDNIRTEKLVIY